MHSTDVWFNAFLLLQGHIPSSHDVIDRGKVRVHWNVSQDDWAKLKRDFLLSDAAKFKTAIEQIKDLGY